jgi:branched-chain amino acid transport system ATP-binding protein
MSAIEIGELVVEAGEIVALLGGNGAGKTRLLETILGFHPGRVLLFGEEVSALAVERRVARGIGYVPEGRRVFAGLTVRENLEASSSLPMAARRRRVEEMLALFPMLGERPQARAWLLSGGQQQMLALARALMDRPRLLLLDEPTLGLAPLVVRDLLQRLAAMAADGTAILLAEQRAALALEIAGRGVVLRRGRIVRQGASTDLAADPTLPDLMAGGSASSLPDRAHPARS